MGECSLFESFLGWDVFKHYLTSSSYILLDYIASHVLLCNYSSYHIMSYLDITEIASSILDFNKS